MRNLKLSVAIIAALSFLLVSCDDSDDNPNTPSETKIYFNTESNYYVYNSYDLNDGDNRIESTEYQDSVEVRGTSQLDGREAYEYQYYTNEEGSYEESNVRYYAYEENKLYLHTDFLTSGLTDIEGVNANDIFQVPGQWMLIADNENSGSWEVLTNDFETSISGVPVTGDLTISSRKDGSEQVSVMGENYTADKYVLTLSIDASADILGSPIPINFSLDIEMLMVDGIGIVSEKQANVSIDLQLQQIEIDGYESILVDYQ